MRSGWTAVQELPDRIFSASGLALLLGLLLVLAAVPGWGLEAGRAQGQDRDWWTEPFLADILESVPTGIGVVERDVLVQVNTSILDLTGYFPEELIGRNIRDLFPTQAEAEDLRRAIHDLVPEPGIGSLETLWEHKDGRIIHVLLAWNLFDPATPADGFIFNVLDITDRKQSEERFTKAFNSSPAPLVISEIETGRFIDVNDRWVEMLGHTREEQIGRTSKELGIWSDPTERDRIVATLRDQDYFSDEPIRFKTKTGEDRYALWSAEVITLDGQKVMLSLIRDETDRKLAETALAAHVRIFLIVVAVFIAMLLALVAKLSASLRHRKAAEERLRTEQAVLQTITTSARDAIIMMSPDGSVAFWNPAAERIFGYAREQALGSQLHSLLAPERYQGLYNQAIARFQTNGQGAAIGETLELEGRRADGTEISIELSLSAMLLDDGWHAVGIIRDISERKRVEAEREQLQAQLLQAQKMESVGILAGGVAHDFNNLLHAMRGNIELLAKSESLEPQSAIRLRNIIRSMDRAAQLVQQLLIFSRKVESGKKRVDLNQEVREAARILEQALPGRIALELRLAPAVWPLFADPKQIEQLLLNLADNAVDAMPDGGKLVLETGNIVLDEEFVRLHPGSTAGRHLFLTVSDTGCGMDATTLKHAFDPFFTTKEVGKGTGLGLASVYGIVMAHGGYIHCCSEPGQGATFQVYLPAQEEWEAAAVQPQPDPVSREGGETVLVVDDETEIRDLSREALEDLGYTVLSAASGEAALQIYREQGQNIDLVLLDLSMPGLGGHQCLRQLLELDPSAKVLIASGYSAQGQAKDALSNGAKGFIGKPFRLEELADKVRGVLDETERGAQSG